MKIAAVVLRIKNFIFLALGRFTPKRRKVGKDFEVDSRSFVFGSEFEYSKVRVGDQLDGRLVERIYYSGLNALIYRAGGEISYLSRIKKNSTKALIYQLESLLSEALLKFRGVHKFVLEEYKLNLLALIYGSDIEGVELAGGIFESLKRFIDDKPKVTYIFEVNGAFVVYVSSKGEVAYQVREMGAHSSLAFSEFHRLKALALSVLPKRKLEIFNHKLASGFIAALRSRETDVSECFLPVKTYLDKTVNNLAGLYLVLSVLGNSVVILTIVFLVYFYKSTAITLNLNMLLAGIAGGLTGAVISVLQRSKDLKVAIYDSTNLLVLQAMARVGLGCCFGVIAIVASKSGLLFEFLSGDHKKMFLLAVIAGFSERMIPDFIEKVSEDKKP